MTTASNYINLGKIKKADTQPTENNNQLASLKPFQRPQLLFIYQVSEIASQTWVTSPNSVISLWTFL